MKTKRRQDRTWLLATARAVAEQLKAQSKGTRLQTRIPRGTSTTNTDGWSAILGNLGSGQPRLELWLDRFSGYPDRKLFACFRSETRQQLMTVTKRVSRKLWPVRTVTSDDTETSPGLSAPSARSALQVVVYFRTRQAAFWLNRTRYLFAIMFTVLALICSGKSCLRGQACRVQACSAAQ